MRKIYLDHNEEIAGTFNDFFTKAVSNLNIPQYEDQQIEDPILWVTEQCKSHLSILAIDAMLKGNYEKLFRFIFETQIHTRIQICYFVKNLQRHSKTFNKDLK